MYDFERDELREGERVPYKVIQWRLLNNYYFFCRLALVGESGFKNIRDAHLNRIVFAYQKCEEIYSRPIEKLMLEVLTLVLDAGRSKNIFEKTHRQKIRYILENNNFGEMLLYLPEEEKRTFEADLDLLKIVR
ncbi:hypothetical protein ABIC71_001929 [Herbaspirillum seropedicae]|uniref:hypothetical protein n=1 Tax=Herbaspirillum seropedicae TaxID=964 RepID=UPI0033931141